MYDRLVRSCDELQSCLVESQTDIEREFLEIQGSQQVCLRGYEGTRLTFYDGVCSFFAQ